MEPTNGDKLSGFLTWQESLERRLHELERDRKYLRIYESLFAIYGFVMLIINLARITLTYWP